MKKLEFLNLMLQSLYCFINIYCRNLVEAGPSLGWQNLIKCACINHIYCKKRTFLHLRVSNHGSWKNLRVWTTDIVQIQETTFMASPCFGSRVLKKFACMNHGYCTNTRNNFYGICVFQITDLEKISVYKPRWLSELLENLRVSIQGSWQISVYKSWKYLICRVFIHGSCKIAMIWNTDILQNGKFMPK